MAYDNWCGIPMAKIVCVLYEDPVKGYPKTYARDDIRALESGQLAGYAGDVWFPQPAPRDHPWRTMPFEAMTPHTSGSSLSAQARYATRGSDEAARLKAAPGKGDTARM